MRRAFIVTAFISLLVPAGLTLGSPNASAGYRLDGPFTYENLSFYRVHNGVFKAPAPLDVGTAFKQGMIKLHKPTTSPNATVDNLSDSEVFVQFGTLLVGATQDQLISTELILPPRSTGTPIDVFCIEKGRWLPRLGEDVANYSTTGALLPASVAQLGFLAGSVHSLAAGRLRQLEVWMSIDDFLRDLSGKIGTSAEQLASPTSLPLGLNNPALQSAEQNYLDALQPKGESEADIVGVAFAINGKLQNADVYSSNDLFRHMWPNLLRTATAQAIANRGVTFQAPPEASRTSALLSESEGTPVSDPMLAQFDGIETHYGNSVVYYESKSGSHWLHRGYLVKDNLAPPAATLRSTALRMLETDAIGDRAVIATPDEHSDQVFQTWLLSSIAKDYEHSILESTNIESRTSERSRMLLEPTLTHTGAESVSPRIIDQLGAAARASADDSEIFKWLIPPLLVPLLCAAVCLLVRCSLRHRLTARRNAIRTNDGRVKPAATLAYARPQFSRWEIGEGDFDPIFGCSDTESPRQAEEHGVLVHDARVALRRSGGHGPSWSVVRAELQWVLHAAFDSTDTTQGGQLVASACPKKRQHALSKAA